MSKNNARLLAAAVLASLSFSVHAEEGQAAPSAEAAPVPAEPAAAPIAAPGGEAGYGQMPPMPAGSPMDPGYGQMMAPPYGQMTDPGYGQMPEPAYGQGMMPGYGQPMAGDYGQVPYGASYGTPYEQMPYGYGGQPVPPAMLSQQAMPQGAQYPAMGNPYREMQAPAYQGAGPGMHSGFRAARMAERDAFHQAMMEKLDAIAARLDRIEKALQERGE